MSSSSPQEQGEHSKDRTKKVEWNLDRNEVSEDITVSPAAHWDDYSETSHFLSYFLGDHPGSHPPHVPASDSNLTHSLYAMEEEDHLTSELGSSDGDPVLPPPTPAVQFYSHSTKPSEATAPTEPQPHQNHHQGTSSAFPTTLVSSSSSSSLSSVAAALVAGKPELMGAAGAGHYTAGGPPTAAVAPHSTKNAPFHGGAPAPAPAVASQSHSTENGFSPLSPAAMIGTGHENLMLPGYYPDHPIKSSSLPDPSGPLMHPPYPPATMPKTQVEQSQHLAWLQQINAIARAQHTILPPPPTTPSAVVPGFPIPTGFPSHHPTAMYPPAPRVAESEEKRARRLERNRESAKKSRRRKKERLERLGEAVNRLHTQIEEERRKHVNKMNGALQQRRAVLLQALPPAVSKEELSQVLLTTGWYSQERQEVVRFQYNTLSNLLLPPYQKFVAWLTLHKESFFMAGKENHARREGKQSVSSGKVSSKMVGEDLTNRAKAAKKSKAAKKNGERSDLSAEASDGSRLWPLLCYELSISVDLEDRLVAAQQRLHQSETVPNDRSNIALATQLTSRLKEAILLHSHRASDREQKTLDILTPQQMVQFQKWFAKNRDRCQTAIQKPETNDVAKEASLEDVCDRLDRVLRISKQEN